MSENVPTFGRENLASEGEKTDWDYWTEWHEKVTSPEYRRLGEPPEPEST